MIRQQYRKRVLRSLKLSVGGPAVPTGLPRTFAAEFSLHVDEFILVPRMLTVVEMGRARSYFNARYGT